MKSSVLPPLLHRRVLHRFAFALIAAGAVVPAIAQRPEPVPLSQHAAPDASQPTAPAAASPTPNQMVLNFQAADLQAVVKAISQMTGRNFLLDPRVKGQITIISAKPVSSATAYQIFVSALKAQGFAVVEGPGNLVKIVPSAEARQHAPVSTAEMPGGGEQIVTHVVTVQHTSPSQMVPLLRPLMAPTSQLAAHEPANALIITDYADNVRRLLRVIEKIDQPVSSDVNIITLQHASALDMADMLSRLALPGSAGAQPQPGVPAVAGGGDRFSIVPDLRTNSLLVRADNPGRVNQLRSLVGKLDVPATTGGNTRVIYLRNAEAVKLADVLRGLLAGEARSQTAAAAPVAAGLPARSPTAGRSAEPSLIQADEATNALIINASDAVYNNLRAVIEKLDVRRAQVYVEALIVEMSNANAMELGVQWAGATGAGSGAVGGFTNFPNANPSLFGAAIPDPLTGVPSGLASSAGLTLAYLGKKITLPDGREIFGLGALARALETASLGNILSTPNLMTLDNAEATITVAKNVPFVTGSFAQGVGTPGSPTAVNPFQTIERKDIGLILKIKPQISEGGTVKLEIAQEVSSIAATAVTGAVDLVTDKRSIETIVVVDDGDTIVLGGLIQDQSNESEQSVPLLGRIPILGALFRYRENTTTKTNLMIFLRPVVIRGPDDGFRHTTDRYDYLRAQPLNRQQKDALDRISPRRPTAPAAQGKLGPPSLPQEFAN